MSRRSPLQNLNYELDHASSTAEKRLVRRSYLRAVIETINERSLSCVIPEPRRPRVNTSDAQIKAYVRFIPYWRSCSDDELDELYDILNAYFSHPSNMRYSRTTLL